MSSDFKNGFLDSMIQKLILGTTIKLGRLSNFLNEHSFCYFTTLCGVDRHMTLPE